MKASIVAMRHIHTYIHTYIYTAVIYRYILYLTVVQIQFFLCCNCLPEKTQIPNGKIKCLKTFICNLSYEIRLLSNGLKEEELETQI